MWENLLSWVRLLWTTGAETEKNTREIEELIAQNRQLAEGLRALALQRIHDEELNSQRLKALEQQIDSLKYSLEQRVRDEAEKSELRLRLEISERSRQLPPEKSDK